MGADPRWGDVVCDRMSSTCCSTQPGLQRGGVTDMALNHLNAFQSSGAGKAHSSRSCHFVIVLLGRTAFNIWDSDIRLFRIGAVSAAAYLPWSTTCCSRNNREHRNLQTLIDSLGQTFGRSSGIITSFFFCLISLCQVKLLRVPCWVWQQWRFLCSSSLSVAGLS